MTATLAEVRAEIANRLETVSGLTVYSYYNATPTPPCAIVGWPERLEATQRIGGNPYTWEAVIPIQILVTMGEAKSADTNLARYCDPDGPYSVQAVFDDDQNLGGLVGMAVVDYFDQFGVAQFSEQGVQYLSVVANLSVYAS